MENNRRRLRQRTYGCTHHNQPLKRCCVGDWGCESDCCLPSVEDPDTWVCKLIAECDAVRPEEDGVDVGGYIQEQLPLLIGITLPLLLIVIIFCFIALRSYQKRWWSHRQKVKIKQQKKEKLPSRSYDLQRIRAREIMEQADQPNRLEWFFVSQSMTSDSSI